MSILNAYKKSAHTHTYEIFFTIKHLLLLSFTTYLCDFINLNIGIA